MKAFTVVTSLIVISLVLPAVCQESKTFGCFVTEPVCPNANVSFYLYTRSTQNNPVELDLANPDSIRNANYVSGRPLKVLMHGFTGDRDYSPNSHIRPAYFQQNDYNIISVDYPVLVKSPCYISGVRNLPTVANCSAKMLNFMIDEGIFNLEDIHVIGFSLGAQAAGMIANYMPEGRKLKRITGLDPAKPLFVNVAEDDRIDLNDAEFVDIIHTDVFDRGLLVPLGHVDFYVNGGFNQPGCRNQTDATPGSCNHDRAPIYYAESINSNIGFWGFRCAHWYLYIIGVCQEKDDDTLAIMGEHADNMSRGLYFLSTNNESPYARGKDFSSNKWAFSSWLGSSDGKI